MTRTNEILTSMLLAGIAMSTFALRAKPQTQYPPCAVVHKALSDYGRLKVGLTRKEIERTFVPDGGLQFTGSTRYSYTACPYIKIDVKFKLPGSGNAPNSPDDVSIEISKMYIENPVAD